MIVFSHDVIYTTQKEKQLFVCDNEN